MCVCVSCFGVSLSLYFFALLHLCSLLCAHTSSFPLSLERARVLSHSLAPFLAVCLSLARTHSLSFSLFLDLSPSLTHPSAATTRGTPTHGSLPTAHRTHPLHPSAAPTHRTHPRTPAHYSMRTPTSLTGCTQQPPQLSELTH